MGKARHILLLLFVLGFGALQVDGSLIDTILAALANATDCASCHALLVPLQVLAQAGDAPFVDTMTQICEDLKLEDEDVCAGAVAREGPILAHDLRQISPLGITATKLCDAFFGLCDSPPVTPFTVPFPKAAPASPKVFTSSGREPFQVVHVSDVHIDHQYTVGAEANCTKSICCRNFADQQGAPTVPAEPNGNSHCDSPVSLADSMLDAITQLGAGSAFTIFTGDVVEGAIWSIDQQEVTEDLESFNQQLLSKLGGALGSVFPSLGNHDSAPVNSFPRATSSTNNNSQWVFDTQSAGWAQWIGSNAADEVQHGSGSYAVQVQGMDLRIISVNTQYWYKQNFWLYDSDDFQPDPNGILAFIVDQLQAAEDAGHRAWIIGHIPLGKEDTMNDQSNYYDQILQRYRNTIAAHFFGHSHKDQFEIAYSDYSHQTAATAVNIAFISPALTPTSGNPAFRIYDVDPDTFEVMDVKVYMTNISDPSFHIEPVWELYYSARDTYGPLVEPPLPSSSSLNPAFWHNLTEVFESDDQAFQDYNARMSRGAMVIPCTGQCKNTTICDMRAFRSENNCDVPTPGIAFKREASDVPGISMLKTQKRAAGNECEGNGLSASLARMLLKVQTTA